VKSKPLFPSQTVTQSGLPPSQELVEIIQRIVGDILTNETDIAAVAADLAAESGSGTWTPAITATVGSITTLGAVSGSYNFVGDLVFINLDIAITTNGVAAGGIQSTLPFTPAGVSVVAGRELNVTGSGLTGTITTGPSVITIYNYNNTYPAGSGYRLLVSGWYRRVP
jgi:hypothetical protein